MYVIFESISAGLIISLINSYIRNTSISDTCMNDTEEGDASEMVSVATGISDSSTTHHVHVYYH